MIRSKIRRSIVSRTTREISAKAQDSRRKLRYQALERREVLSAVSFVEGGVLTIQADDEPNEIVAWTDKEANTLVIQVDETTLEFTDSDIEQINIFGNGLLNNFQTLL